MLTAFFLGIGSGALALAIEKVILYVLNPENVIFSPSFEVVGIADLVGPFVFSFLFAAIVEESTKFIILKKYFEITVINQVIDGMKIGLAMGLGFAFLENFFYFFDTYNSGFGLGTIAVIFLLRGVLSTLAHSLYGIIMGYYLSLAKFHVAYRFKFLRSGLIASVLAHGFFNFFLITDMGIYSVIMLTVFLVIVLHWYNDRKNLELYITSKDKTLVVSPFLAEKLEKEIFALGSASQETYLDKLWGLLMSKEK